jgi:HAD superfamily hydrolase (TIGR01509 family)
MDGVIVDSTEAHTEAWREYLKGHGLEIPDIHLRMLGKHNDEIVRDFFCDLVLSDEEVTQHGTCKEALYRQRIEPVFDTCIVPGVREFIRRNSAIPMGVASNAESANVEFVLSLAGVRDCFSVLVNGHDVQRPKPWPDIYLKAASLLGLPASDCIVFEDSETGVAAARAAGMRVVGLLTTLDRFDNVDLAISDFEDPALESWLQRNSAA